MEGKYLPIGTICTLKDNEKKYMIVSYFSVEYNDTLTLYDYKGCVYPEGLLLPSQSIPFNHDDIESVDYMGYENEQFKAFNEGLNRQYKLEAEEEHEVANSFMFDNKKVDVLSSIDTNKNDYNPYKTVEDDLRDVFLKDPVKEEFTTPKVEPENESVLGYKTDFDEDKEETLNPIKSEGDVKESFLGFPIKEDFTLPKVEPENESVIELIKDDKVDFDEEKKEEPSPIKQEKDVKESILGVPIKDDFILPKYGFDNETVSKEEETSNLFKLEVTDTKSNFNQKPVEKIDENNFSFPKYDFDENGLIVKSNSPLSPPIIPNYEHEDKIESNEEKKEELPNDFHRLPKFNFNDDEIIIKDNSLPKEAKYEFDDNGVVIKDNTVE